MINQQEQPLLTWRKVQLQTGGILHKQIGQGQKSPACWEPILYWVVLVLFVGQQQRRIRAIYSCWTGSCHVMIDLGLRGFVHVFVSARVYMMNSSWLANGWASWCSPFDFKRKYVLSYPTLTRLARFMTLHGMFLETIVDVAPDLNRADIC